ncbi:MAG TPA: hypothetical protein VIJ21_05795, partial [Solirubrobacterales bacterium]
MDGRHRVIAAAVDRLGESSWCVGFGGWRSVANSDLLIALIEAEAEQTAAGFVAVETLLPYVVFGDDGELKLLVPDDPATAITVARAYFAIGWNRDAAE